MKQASSCLRYSTGTCARCGMIHDADVKIGHRSWFIGSGDMRGVHSRLFMGAPRFASFEPYSAG